MKNLLIIILFLALVSCHEEIQSQKGRIDIFSNVYFDSSKGLDKMKSFHISSLNYSGDSIIERIPDVDIPDLTSKCYFIKDSLCYNIEIGNANSIILSEITKKQKPIFVEKKIGGALFSQEKIPNYRNRKNLSDTILFKKKYRRFEINSPWMYSRFYIYPTDTILPYSIYKHAEKDYNGRLERIDSYNKKTDTFVTLQLIPTNNWDDFAKDIFEYNIFIKNNSK